MGKRLICLLFALAMVLSGTALAENTEAPRAYFPYPIELENLPDITYLPDLFEFFDASVDPNGNGRVDTPEEWPARAAELRDMLSYYVYGSRMDPLKSDTTVTRIIQNYAYTWADGVMGSEASRWGYTALPNLPEGSYTMSVRDFSAFGMGLYYSNIGPDESYVHSGDEFPMGDYKAWKEGDTWADHEELVARTELPTVTVEMLIKDTNPANEAWRSELASEGITWTFDIRFPKEPPVVDGVVRDEKASRHGTGYPLVVGLGSLSEQQIVTLNNCGYVFVAVNDSNDPDRGQISCYEKLYPPEDPIVYNDNTIKNAYMQDSGDLMHSGWIASRALDAIENYMLLSDEEKDALNPEVRLPAIDVYSSAFTGCSNNGKRALIGAIYDTGKDGDTRVDIAAPSDAGAGGLTGFRYSSEGQLHSYEPPVQNVGGQVVVHNYPYGFCEELYRAIIVSNEDHWFGDRAQIFNVRPDLNDNIPFDQHALLAIYASAGTNRYIIGWLGEGQDAWANHPASVLDSWAANEVYEFLGKGRVIPIARDQAHANQDRDLPELIAIMDYEYYNTGKITRKYYETLTSNGFAAKDGNGTILPDYTFDSVADMERNPYFIRSAYLPWSRPTKHTLWSDCTYLTEGMARAITFHSDADRVELLLADGETVVSADVKDGVAVIELTADQVKPGQFRATAIGSKDPKSIELCIYSMKDALRHGIGDTPALQYDVGAGPAFTSNVVNYASKEDPVRLYMNGIELPADIYDYDNKVMLDNGEVVPQSGYLQPYGATLTLFEGTEGYNVPHGEKVTFSVRNVKLNALPGYIIAMDVELEKYDPNNGRGAVRHRWAPTYPTLNPQTPVWEPELLQNTPKSGLPAGEDRWPVLGNWVYDYDENGTLKPVDEIRPIYSGPTQTQYDTVITLQACDAESATLAFNEPVNPHDFAVATSIVGVSFFEWADDCMSVRLVYDHAVEAGTEIDAYVFRSVDADLNMIGGYVQFTFRF